MDPHDVELRAVKAEDFSAVLTLTNNTPQTIYYRGPQEFPEIRWIYLKEGRNSPTYGCWPIGHYPLAPGASISVNDGFQTFLYEQSEDPELVFPWLAGLEWKDADGNIYWSTCSSFEKQ